MPGTRTRSRSPLACRLVEVRAEGRIGRLAKPWLGGPLDLRVCQPKRRPAGAASKNVPLIPPPRLQRSLLRSFLPLSSVLRALRAESIASPPVRTALDACTTIVFATPSGVASPSPSITHNPLPSRLPSLYPPPRLVSILGVSLEAQSGCNTGQGMGGTIGLQFRREAI